jgi:hypothetical protein
MLSWVRRTFGWFERRWIRDPSEREQSTRRVRTRLGLGSPDEHDAAPTGEERAPAGTEPTAER